MEDPAGAKFPWKGADTFGKIQPMVANKSIDPKKNKSGNLFKFRHFKKEEILFCKTLTFKKKGLIQLLDKNVINYLGEKIDL